MFTKFVFLFSESKGCFNLYELREFEASEFLSPPNSRQVFAVVKCLLEVIFCETVNNVEPDTKPMLGFILTDLAIKFIFDLREGLQVAELQQFVLEVVMAENPLLL